jgi:hypothetical protein
MRPNLSRLPQHGMRMPIFALSASAVLALATAALTAAQDQKPERIMSLMETLEQWKYPGSRMLGRASMSDGGNPLLQSVKCKATLTTPDPFQKVIMYYSQNHYETRADKEPRGGVPETDGKSVASQDDSEDRSVKIRVIVVNRANTSTTLVISQAREEKETHIAWLHYIRLDAK